MKTQSKLTTAVLMMTVFVLTAALGIWSAFDSTKLFLVTALCFLGCLYYAVRRLEENVFLFSFLACFATFLLFGHTVNKFTRVYGGNFSPSIELHVDTVLLLSLLSLLAGYIAIDKGVRKCAPRPVEDDKRLVMRKSGKLLYFCCYPFWIVALAEKVFFVAANGYTAYYTSFASALPSLLLLPASMAPIFFYFFLATMPSKKEAALPLLLYFAYNTLSLATGRRLSFITGLLVVFSYLMLRNRIACGTRKWLPKKWLITLCIAAPLLLTVMYLFEYLRADAAVGNSAQYFPLFGFFVRQGTSVNVLKYAQLFADRLREDACYSFYSTLKWLSDSFLEKLFGFEVPFAFGRQSEAVALNGTSLADFVSYHANRKAYLSGIGYGSSYVEELFVDFGTLGVVIGNILYGAVLCLFLKKAPQRRNIWLTAIGFCCVESLFVAPRASFDAPFARLLYTEFLLPLLLMVILVNWTWLRKKVTPVLSAVDRAVFQKPEAWLVKGALFFHSHLHTLATRVYTAFHKVRGHHFKH